MAMVVSVEARLGGGCVPPNVGLSRRKRIVKNLRFTTFLLEIG
jgi:hypothetical protein